MKTKNIRGGYILISLGMIALSTSLSTLEIDYKRLTETKKSIRLCNINIGGAHKPDIDIKPEFGTNKITLPDVYGLDLIVSSDNSVEIIEHRSAYELPIPEVSDEGKSVIVDSEGKYALGSGGASLYLHTLYFNDGGEGEAKALISVVSIDKEPYTASNVSSKVGNDIDSSETKPNIIKVLPTDDIDSQNLFADVIVSCGVYDGIGLYIGKAVLDGTYIKKSYAVPTGLEGYMNFDHDTVTQI